MYKVFNMGHRMEVYTNEDAAKALIDISESLGVKAQIVGAWKPTRASLPYPSTALRAFIVTGNHGLDREAVGGWVAKFQGIADRFREVEARVSDCSGF